MERKSNKFGYVEAGQLITIDMYFLVVAESFSVYEKIREFDVVNGDLLEPYTGENKVKAFLDTLITRNLGVPLTKMPPDSDPMIIDFRLNQINREFSMNVPIPTEEQLDEFWALGPNLVPHLNVHQVRTLVNHMDIEVEETQVRHCVIGLNSEPDVNWDRIMPVVVACNLIKLREQEAENMKKYGFVMEAIGADKPEDHSFAYTRGLAEKYGLELLIVGRISRNFLGSVLGSVALHVTSGKHPTTFTDFPMNEPMKGKVVQVVSPFLFTEYMLGAAPKDGEPEPKVYQILISDKEGIFPGEEGHDESFNEIIPASIFLKEGTLH